MQAWFVLAETNMPRSAMLVGYRGVRFDQTGQNVESATYLTQLQGMDDVTTWPDALGNARQVWPMTDGTVRDSHLMVPTLRIELRTY